MPVIMTRMPSGFAGEITRTAGAILEPCIVGSADISHGDPVKLAGDKIVPLEAGDTAADVYGFVARSYPSQGGAAPVEGTAAAGSTADVLRSGYMAVALAAGTPAKGGTVYVRIAENTGRVGDIQAALIADETVAVNATFMGEADANGVTEIAYNI
jgi:hypothetical protein